MASAPHYTQTGLEVGKPQHSHPQTNEFSPQTLQPSDNKMDTADQTPKYGHADTHYTQPGPQYGYPAANVEKESKHGTICGFRSSTFCLLLALIFVIIGAAVGGGVGGSIAVKNAKR